MRNENMKNNNNETFGNLFSKYLSHNNIQLKNIKKNEPHIHIKDTVNKFLNMYLGNQKIDEYNGGNNYTNLIYNDGSIRDNLSDAYKKFVNVNITADTGNFVNLNSIRSFLKHVYMGGDHDINLKDFIKYLIGKNVKIRNNKISEKKIS